jgi:uncharacterized damage-inducible protein DinB
MSTSALQSLFAYKAWANVELFAALHKLPATHAEQLHTCIRTLNHIYVVDCLFRARLAGESVPFHATNTKETPTLDQLRGDVEVTDAWYVDYASKLTDAALSRVLSFTFADGDAGQMSVEEILLHVSAHGAYHRGNVGQVLKSIDVVPPRDLYTKFLHMAEPQRRQA